jgi:Gnt-I system low-affinity gluconate transporter
MSAMPLLLVVVASVAVIIGLIMGLRMHPFVALLLVSFSAAIVVGIPLSDIAGTIQEGMGGALGYVAVVVGLGAMLGEVLRVTGGAEQIARRLVRSFGEERAPWGLTIAGFLIAIPVFSDIGIVLLIPLAFTLVKRTGKPLLFFAIPLLGGLATTHTFVPPTPGPVAAAAILNADLGWVILFGIIAGIPSAAIGGVVFGKYISQKITVGIPARFLDSEQVPEGELQDRENKSIPSFALSLSILLVPLVLILLATTTGVILPDDSSIGNFLAFLGHPFAALTIGVLLAFYVLGVRHGYSREEISGVATKALEPVGLIILVTGAGGVFGAVLIEGGVGEALENFLEASGVPLIFLAFGAAALIRVSLGSATVAMVTGASLIAPIIEAGSYSAPLVALLVTAVAAGAIILSHVNDSGFWLASQYLGLSTADTLRSFTIMTTIVGLVGFAAVLVISLLL